MAISYTHIARYLENEARAFDYYVDHNQAAYPQGESDALVYGIVAHAQIAGEQPDLPDEALNRQFLRGNPEKGYKAAFKTLDKAVQLAKHIRGEIIHGEFKSEVQAENELFKGRLDTVSDDTIIDYKFVNVSDFDKAWNGQNYDDWIYSTHYLLQAYLYLHLMPRKHYYIVAINKSNLNFRVYDLSSLQYNLEMEEDLNELLSHIEAIENGSVEPVYVNDGSDWAIEQAKHKPINPVLIDYKNVL